MNILVLSWRDPKNPLAGGAEQVMHEHMKGWVDAGHKVTLFTSEFKDCAREEIIDRVKIIRWGNPLLTVYIKAIWWYLFINKSKFDLVIDQFHGIPFFTPLYVKTKKMAVIQEVAKEVWFLNHLPFPLNHLFGVAGTIIEPVAFLFYKNVPFLTGSESAKKEVIQMGIPSNQIFIINHGVLIPKIKNFSKEKVKTIIFLGALAKDKGIEDALKSFSLLNKKGIFKFWVIGKGSDEYMNYLKDMCKNLGILKNTKFFGFVSQIEKFKLLSKGHVLVNPSIREGWGLVNIEANLVKTPVVAYRSQGLIDSVKDGASGILCLENTPQSLVENIDKIMKNKKLLNRLQVGSVKWANKFSWEKSKNESLCLIEKIANEY